MSNEQKFKDRVSQNPNRRKLKIVSQNSNELVVDIERFDNATEEGTPINAAVLNEWDQKVNEASSTIQQITKNVDCNEAGKVGTPTVEIKEILGEKRFVFKNLKGETGGTQFLFNGVAKSKVNFQLSGSVLQITTE